MRNPVRVFAWWASSVCVAACLAFAAPASAADSREAANEKLVLDFFHALDDAEAAGTLVQRIDGIAEKYVAPDYAQHGELFTNLPGPGNGRDKMVRFFKTTVGRPMSATAATPAKLVSIAAKGDKVMVLTSREIPDSATGQTKTYFVFNMFRIAADRLVEHWELLEMPPSM
jgi:predicted SnoaL-like aldol condensation-catalyzing enzyme